MLDALRPTRRSTRLREYDYSQVGAYFATICTRERACLFGHVACEEIRLSEVGEIARSCWLQIPAHFPTVELDTFVVMPNHIHGIIVLADGEIRGDWGPGDACVAPTPMEADRGRPKLGTIIGSFKAASTREANARFGGTRGQLWQRGYHDHIIRSEAALARIRQYIADNPRKWALDHDNPANWH